MHTGRHCRTAVVFVSAIVLLAATSVSAQVGNRAGFFGGVNFAGQGGDMEELGELTAAIAELEVGGTWSSSVARNPGHCFGGFYTVQSSPTFAWQFEAQIVRRGSRIELAGTGVGGFMGSAKFDADFELNYIEIPVLVRLTPNSAGKFRPIFLAGPVLGIKMSANLKTSGEGQSHSEDFSDNCAASTIGLLGGVGFTAPVGSASYLTVQARYYLGLTEPFDDGVDAKSGDFGVFAGMEFSVGE